MDGVEAVEGEAGLDAVPGGVSAAAGAAAAGCGVERLLPWPLCCCWCGCTCCCCCCCNWVCPLPLPMLWLVEAPLTRPNPFRWLGPCPALSAASAWPLSPPPLPPWLLLGPSPCGSGCMVATVGLPCDPTSPAPSCAAALAHLARVMAPSLLRSRIHCCRRGRALPAWGGS